MGKGKGFMRGTVLDSGVTLILVFVLAIVLVSIAYVGNILTTTGNTTIDSYTTTAYQGTTGLNMIAPFMVLGLGIALIISAVMIRSHPAFFFVFLIINGVFAYCSMFLSNAWQSIFTGSALGTVAQTFTAWTWLFQYMPFISIILGMIFAIAVYVKGGE